MAPRVVVAMSGGVDSSVAAALLVEQGYDVVGVTLDLWPKLQPDEAERRDGCCSLAAVEDARRVADALGFPHYTLNFRDIFAQTVIADFVREYGRGRTPNPCIRCNEHVKFDALLRRAEALGADLIATGHYARAGVDPASGRYLLRRGLDRGKDQSYPLYVLRQAQLAKTLFPLGGLHKEETRRLAARLGLSVADKPDSQEICFVPDDDYGGFLRRYAGLNPPPGPIVDTAGQVLGEHRGIPYYTVGQRRGLGLATGRALYVVAIDPERNAVIVGDEEDLLANGLVAGEVNLISMPAIDGALRLTVKIRYRALEVAARLEPRDDDTLAVFFDRPQRAPAPGQAVVFYDGELVIGGGTILSSIPVKA